MNKLNLGCGRKMLKGYDNFDKKDFDLNVFPYPIEDNSYDLILLDNVLEHLDDRVRVIEECHRILRKGGILHIISPHWHSFNGYRDLSHRCNGFCVESFDQFIIGKDTYDLTGKKFSSIKARNNPTVFGMIFPKRILNFLSLFIGHLIDSVEVRMVK